MAYRPAKPRRLSALEYRFVGRDGMSPAASEKLSAALDEANRDSDSENEDPESRQLKRPPPPKPHKGATRRLGEAVQAMCSGRLNQDVRFTPAESEVLAAMHLQGPTRAEDPRSPTRDVPAEVRCKKCLQA